MKNVLILCGSVLIAALSGCSSEPASEAKKAEKPPEPVTGQVALYRMFQVARSWAPDVQVVTMHNIHMAEIPEVAGKAGAWQATFASESKNASRSYTYSIIEADSNLHQGVFPGQPEAGSNAPTKPFLIAAVKVDTEAAYKTALDKAGDAARQQKTHTISFLLDKQEKFTNPSWRVIWGESVGTASLSAYIDASTGEYLATMH